MDKFFEIGYLFDFYGNLLSKKQYDAVELYYIHDLSLGEISEQLDISRQGVYDIIKRAEKKLYSFEEKLGLVKKFNNSIVNMEEILKYINNLKNNQNVYNDKNSMVQIKGIEKLVLDILKTTRR
ncbi:YlxM family DNA-binding protein [Abyssisolibacter fermentans]|uniref:YlxM family DNA-binding protein n=1 Tax=Abyssisolibacter fermentans TaxID=1766203 RepID=UPI0008361B7D|nr:YlxM family DNA-binding protein [Abyssisolibacter fermentans]